MAVNQNPHARALAMMAALAAAQNSYGNNQISLEQYEAELKRIGEYRSRGKGTSRTHAKNPHAHMAIVRAARTRRNIRKRA